MGYIVIFSLWIWGSGCAVWYSAVEKAKADDEAEADAGLVLRLHAGSDAERDAVEYLFEANNQSQTVFGCSL